MSTTTTPWPPTPTGAGSALALALILAFMVAEVVAGIARRLARAALRRRAHAHRRRARSRSRWSPRGWRRARRAGASRSASAAPRSSPRRSTAPRCCVLAGVIAIEAVQRLFAPPDVEGGIVIVVGLLGARSTCRGLAARARRAPLAQRRGRARPRAHRPLRVARRRRRGRRIAARRASTRGRRRSPRCWSPALMLRSGWSLLRDVRHGAARGLAGGRRARRTSAARWPPRRGSSRCTTCTCGRSRPASPRSPPTCSSPRATTATAAGASSSSCSHERFGIEHTTLQVDHEAGSELLDIEDRVDGRLVVERAPEVQAGARPVGPPGLGDRLHLGRLGRGGEAVGGAGRVADSRGRRPAARRPVQGEHQEHVRAPLADALDRGQLAR